MNTQLAGSPNIAIVNDPSSGLADAELEPIVAALQKQVDQDFAPAWHQAASLSYVASGQKPPPGFWTVVLLGNSDQAGALGYHDLTPDGLPLGKVFAATDKQYGESVSVTLSHELLEMIADPWINLSAQPPDGCFYAWENCDAVEADNFGYQIDGIQVSDFVYPEWFGNGVAPDGKLDHTGTVTKSLQLAAGGYVSKFDPSAGTGWTQLQAQHSPQQIVGDRDWEQVPDDERRRLVAEAFLKGVPRVGSRRERRFRGQRRWVLSQYEMAVAGA